MIAAPAPETTESPERAPASGANQGRTRGIPDSAGSSDEAHSRYGIQPVGPQRMCLNMLTFVAWLLLAVVSLPLAILALVLFPFVWLLTLPFRLIGVSVSAVFELIGAIIRLPARLLRGSPA